MPKDAVFTMKLEPELREAFLAAAGEEDRPASQIVRELMRGYVEERRRSRDYQAFLQSKVDAARSALDAGQGLADHEVEAVLAARRRAAGLS